MYFLFNRTTLQVFVTYLTGALHVHSLWFYKHHHENRVRSKLFVACQHVAFSLPFAAILVNCAPSGEMHNYCTPYIIKENFENFLIHRCKYILLSQVYCLWQVVNTPTIILNNTVFSLRASVAYERAKPTYIYNHFPGYVIGDLRKTNLNNYWLLLSPIIMYNIVIMWTIYTVIIKLFYFVFIMKKQEQRFKNAHWHCKNLYTADKV